MYLTISGVITSSGTRLPDGSTVSGGCVSCSGSHWVEWYWSYNYALPSGAVAMPDSYPITDGVVYVEEPGEQLKVRDPLYRKNRLLAWHTLDETGDILYDHSGNGIHAAASGTTVPVLAHHDYGRSLASKPYGYIRVNNFPIPSGYYMLSFWFRPTTILTSGIENNFTIFRSCGFYGDHFADVYDYLDYYSYKGWELVNGAQICEVGYNGTYLRLQGNDSTDWFDGTYNASTLSFPIDRSKNWDVEADFMLPVMHSNDQAALILYDSASLSDYCALVFNVKTTSTDYTPTMTSYTSPVPYVISTDSAWPGQEGWKAFDGLYQLAYDYNWHTDDNDPLPHWLMLDYGEGNEKAISRYRFRTRYWDRYIRYPTDWTFQASGTEGWVVLDTRTGESSPGDWATWSSWFEFTNDTAYRHYRWWFTAASEGPNYVCLSMIEMEEANYEGTIVLQTGDLEYELANTLPQPGGYRFKMIKRDDRVSFRYMAHGDSEWNEPAYYYETGLLSDTLRLGLQSRNASSDSPEILVDSFEFTRGLKPATVGDAPDPGRLLITYNRTDVEYAVEDRTDSRIWAQTDPNGFAIGTSTFKWDPEEWYLLQFGFKPNAQLGQDDYVWIVNGKQERVMTVGSGKGSSIPLVAEGYLDTGLDYEEYIDVDYTVASGTALFELPAYAQITDVQVTVSGVFDGGEREGIYPLVAATNTATGPRTHLQRTYILEPGQTIIKTGIYSSTSTTMKFKFCQQDSASQYDIEDATLSGVDSFTHPGTGAYWRDCDEWVVPNTGTWVPGMYNLGSIGNFTTGQVGKNTAYKDGDAVGDNQSGFSTPSDRYYAIGVKYKDAPTCNITNELGQTIYGDFVPSTSGTVSGSFVPVSLSTSAVDIIYNKQSPQPTTSGIMQIKFTYRQYAPQTVGTIDYFDSVFNPASGSFVLDQVSHWDRWLTLEEITKMLNLNSQVAWFRTTGYLDTDIPLLDYDTTVSGDVSQQDVTKTNEFEYHTQWQAGTVPQKTLSIEKRSYRIQRDLRVVAWQIDEFQANIFRCSSGWIALNRDCFDCRDNDVCACDIYGECQIYSRAYDYPVESVPFMHSWKEIERDISYQAYDPTSLSGTLRAVHYDLTGPYVTLASPARNARFIDSGLDWLPQPIIYYDIREPAGVMAEEFTRVWIKRIDQGRYQNHRMDNFSFYEADFSVPPSGYTPSGNVWGDAALQHGWYALNWGNTQTFRANEGFESTLYLNEDVVTSGGTEFTSSGIEDNLALMPSVSYYYPLAQLHTDGTRLLEITTESGSWTSELQEAPFLYRTIPSGLSRWEVTTDVDPYFVGSLEYQFAGLMLSYQDFPAQFIQYVISTSGITSRTQDNQTNPTYYDPVDYTLGSGLALKIKRDYSALTFHYSVDRVNWVEDTGASGTCRSDSDINLGVIVMDETGTDSVTIGFFDYVIYQSLDDANQFQPQQEDDWELLLIGGSPLNSSENSGGVTYSRLTEQSFRLGYEPFTQFSGGEQVYFRFETYSQPTFQMSYEDQSNMLIYVNADGPEGHLDSRPEGRSFNQISGSYSIYTPLGTPVMVSSEDVYQGTHSMEFDGSSYFYTDEMSSEVINNDWTVHTWYKHPTYSPFQLMQWGSTKQDDQFTIEVVGSGVRVYKQEALIASIYRDFGGVEWSHLAVSKDSKFLMFYDDGELFGDVHLSAGPELTSVASGTLYVGYGLDGYMDLYTVESGTRWTTSFYQRSMTDEIMTFKIASESDLNVQIIPDPDTHAPVALPVAPTNSGVNVCPTESIVFDIVDDFAGPDWDDLVIEIGGLTVWSGTNNMTEFYTDRGTLTWEARGQKDGDGRWELQQSTSGEVFVDGVNRQLYPLGTAYSGSGAWGRRFTYELPNASGLDYFGSHMDISISGADSLASPNRFTYDYGFDFVPNDNIWFGNFFMEVGEHEKISVMEARNRVFALDIADYDYPVTDIVESGCSLRMYDGYNDVTLSGIYFTTWTGTAGAASGIVHHRLHWDPINQYNWDGHRTMHFEVTAETSYSGCRVYNVQEYQLLYGWEVLWLHDGHPPFDFNKQLPVFITVKTQDYVPSRMSTSYMLWTAPAKTHDFAVTLLPRPQPKEELQVDLVAHSQYLQYSEDVDVQLICRDRDGNVLDYTFTFSTEDMPE